MDSFDVDNQFAGEDVLPSIDAYDDAHDRSSSSHPRLTHASSLRKGLGFLVVLQLVCLLLGSVALTVFIDTDEFLSRYDSIETDLKEFGGKSSTLMAFVEKKPSRSLMLTTPLAVKLSSLVLFPLLLVLLLLSIPLVSSLGRADCDGIRSRCAGTLRRALSFLTITLCLILLLLSVVQFLSSLLVTTLDGIIYIVLFSRFVGVYMLNCTGLGRSKKYYVYVDAPSSRGIPSLVLLPVAVLSSFTVFALLATLYRLVRTIRSTRHTHDLDKYIELNTIVIHAANDDDEEELGSLSSNSSCEDVVDHDVAASRYDDDDDGDDDDGDDDDDFHDSRSNLNTDLPSLRMDPDVDVAMTTPLRRTGAGKTNTLVRLLNTLVSLLLVVATGCLIYFIVLGRSHLDTSLMTIHGVVCLLALAHGVVLVVSSLASFWSPKSTTSRVVRLVLFAFLFLITCLLVALFIPLLFDMWVDAARDNNSNNYKISADFSLPALAEIIEISKSNKFSLFKKLSGDLSMTMLLDCSKFHTPKLADGVDAVAVQGLVTTCVCFAVLNLCLPLQALWVLSEYYGRSSPPPAVVSCAALASPLAGHAPNTSESLAGRILSRLGRTVGLSNNNSSRYVQLDDTEVDGDGVSSFAELGDL